jgi:hypothetical protein
MFGITKEVNCLLSNVSRREIAALVETQSGKLRNYGIAFLLKWFRWEEVKRQAANLVKWQGGDYDLGPKVVNCQFGIFAAFRIW